MNYTLQTTVMIILRSTIEVEACGFGDDIEECHINPFSAVLWRKYSVNDTASGKLQMMKGTNR
jgi:hypothetical protein